MSGKYYGVKMSDDYEKEMKEISMLVNDGTIVIIVDDDNLDDLGELDIWDDIIMVDRDSDDTTN
jgi:hypothetical protein